MKIEDESFGERTGYVLVEGQEVPINDTVFLNISEHINYTPMELGAIQIEVFGL